jgi:hypothetical protein
MPKVADIVRKVTFGIASVLNSVLPIVYYSGVEIRPEVIIGVNVCNTILLVISERSNTIENTIQKLMNDVKSGNVTQRSLSSIPSPQQPLPEQRNEPITEVESVAVDVEPPNTARDYIRVRPIMHRDTGKIEWVADTP